ncbi:MAG: sulfotransferase [Acetobacteraceae bacterium]|nr:sulfotransferase [Acetobacteraceae bacterium]
MADPRFFCGLGTQKAGTTWLAQYLRGRGDVLTPLVKELHAFDHWFLPRDFAWVPARLAQDLAAANPARAAELSDRLAMAGPADYLAFFRRRLRPHHLAFGEISPSYALLPPEGLAAIRDLTPTTRAVLLLRDPASRLLSEARMEARKKGRALAEQVVATLGQPLALARGRYEEMVPRVESVFPPGRLLILFTETLFTDAAIARLCDFLGLPFRPGDYAAVAGGAPSDQEKPSAEMRAAARTAHADTYAWARDRFGDALPEAWRG